MAYLEFGEDALLPPLTLPAGPAMPLVRAPRAMPKRARTAGPSPVQGAIIGAGVFLLAAMLFFIGYRAIGEVWPALIVVALALLPFAPLAAGPAGRAQARRQGRRSS